MLCYLIGVLCVYLPMKVNEETCSRMYRDYTMIPKSMNFCIQTWNGSQCYENGSYFKYAYGKEWETFIRSLSAEAGNDSGYQVDYGYNESHGGIRVQ
jgi:hypothetical protein